MKEDFITAKDLNLVFGTNLNRLNITGAEIDSRNVKRGNIFFAIDGKMNDGHNFLEQAEKKGVTRSEHIRSALHPYINKSREF